MSTLEIKAKAFEELASINEELDLKKILLFIENIKNKTVDFNTDLFFKEASEKYGDVLQKLAQ